MNQMDIKKSGKMFSPGSKRIRGITGRIGAGCGWFNLGQR